jgi:hypothetical protein
LELSTDLVRARIQLAEVALSLRPDALGKILKVERRNVLCEDQSRRGESEAKPAHVVLSEQKWCNRLGY